MVQQPDINKYVFMRMTKDSPNVTTDSGNVSFNTNDIFFIPYSTAKTFIEKQSAEFV